MSYELQPAYGRDYKTKAEVIAAFNAGKDFEGDYSMGFRKCSKRDFKEGDTVLLRYKRCQNVAVVKVAADKAAGA